MPTDENFDKLYRVAQLAVDRRQDRLNAEIALEKAKADEREANNYLRATLYNIRAECNPATWVSVYNAAAQQSAAPSTTSQPSNAAFQSLPDPNARGG